MAYGYGRRRYSSRRRRSYRRRSYGSRTPRVVVNMPRPAKRRRRTAKKKAPPLTRFQVAQMNPFHPDAVGCKIPDSNSMPSCAIQQVDNMTLTTDAAFQVAVSAFRPFASATRVTGVAASTNSWTWPAAYAGTNSSRQANIVTNFSLLRPVAHGVRLTSSLSPNTVVGEVQIGIYASEMYGEATWDFPASTSELGNLTVFKKFPLAALCSKSVTIVNRTMDFSAEKYLDPASSVAANGTELTFQTTGWATIVVAVVGAGLSTTAVNVEQIVHFEAIPKKTSVASASPAALLNVATLAQVGEYVDRSDPVVMTDANENAVIRQRQDSFIGGITDQLGEYAYGAGRGLARMGVAAAMRYAAGYANGGGLAANGIFAGNPAIMN